MKEKTWEQYSKEELLKLPERDWRITTEYDAVLFVNTRKKHDSGYNFFAIIGCKGSIPTEIVGYMDDFRYGSILNGFYSVIMPYDFAFDCSMKGVFRLHSRNKIVVGDNLSTTSFWFKERAEKNESKRTN